MSDGEQHVNPRGELEKIVEQSHREFDEPDSLQLVARLREIGFIDDANWDRILEELISALRSKPPVRPDGPVNIDADPRNADWIKIVGAQRCAGCRLPSWAAMWLWRIGGYREEPEFWEVVRGEAVALGITERSA